MKMLAHCYKYAFPVISLVVNMKSLTLIAIALFLVALIGIFLYNSTQQTIETTFVFKPLYAFVPGELLSEVNAFFFVLIVSLLLFGVGGVIAMPLEGMKYGSLLFSMASGQVSSFHVFDLLFIIPQLLACIAATTLGAGLVSDYRSKGNMFPYWNSAVKYFMLGVVILAALLLVRPFLV